MEIHETYEQWEERVTSRGKALGKAEGKAEAVLRLLRTRFGPLEPVESQRVARADDEALDAMLDRLLTAATLREALG